RVSRQRRRLSGPDRRLGDLLEGADPLRGLPVRPGRLAEAHQAGAHRPLHAGPARGGPRLRGQDGDGHGPGHRPEPGAPRPAGGRRDLAADRRAGASGCQGGLPPVHAAVGGARPRDQRGAVPPPGRGRRLRSLSGHLPPEADRLPESRLRPGAGQPGAPGSVAVPGLPEALPGPGRRAVEPRRDSGRNPGGDRPDARSASGGSPAPRHGLRPRRAAGGDRLREAAGPGPGPRPLEAGPGTRPGSQAAPRFRTVRIRHAILDVVGAMDGPNPNRGRRLTMRTRVVVGILAGALALPAAVRAAPGAPVAPPADRSEVRFTIGEAALLDLLKAATPYTFNVGNAYLKVDLTLSEPRDLRLLDSKATLKVRLKGSTLPVDQILSPVFTLRHDEALNKYFV